MKLCNVTKLIVM